MEFPFGGEDITSPVVTPDMPDPKKGSADYGHALIRDRSTYSIEAMPWLPKSPDSDEWAKELYDRIEAAERT